MLRKKIRLISLIIATILITNNVALAASCTPAVSLKVGQSVTDCDRVGVAKEVMQQIDKDLAEGDFNKQIVEEQKKVISLKDLRISESDQQTTLWKADSQREREAYDKERARSDTKFWVGMGLGVLTILAGAYVVKQVAR